MTTEELRAILKEELQPLRDELSVVTRQVERNQVTLFGEQGNNGLNGTVKEHTKTIEDIRKFQYKSLGGLAVLGVLIGAVSHFIASIFDKN